MTCSTLLLSRSSQGKDTKSHYLMDMGALLDVREECRLQRGVHGNLILRKTNHELFKLLILGQLGCLRSKQKLPHCCSRRRRPTLRLHPHRQAWHSHCHASMNTVNIQHQTAGSSGSLTAMPIVPCRSIDVRNQSHWASSNIDSAGMPV